jgi:DNA-binding IclR family transcriptional regulator
VFGYSGEVAGALSVSGSELYLRSERDRIAGQGAAAARAISEQ